MSTTLLKQDAFTGLRESHEAQEAYRGYLDAADPGNRLVRRRYGLGGSGDWHLQPWQLWYVREQCYHAARNDGLPGQVTERLVDQVLGNNFRLEPNTGDTGMDRELKDRWACFTGDARLCDHDQLYDWDAMTWHAMLNMVLGGDHFGVGTQDGQIQMIEASRCVSPAGANGMNSMVIGDLSTIADPVARTYNGVTLGRWGGIDGYTFSRGVPLSPYALNADYFPRYNEQGVQLVFHTYSTHRCTQHRGYPWWTPILADMGMLSDLDFAMLLKAQMAASVAGVAESDKEASGARLNLGGGPAPENVVGPGGEARLQFKLAMGSIMALPPGVHYKAFTAAVPNSEHFEHVRHTMKRIGGALHLPLVVMLLDASVGGMPLR